MSFNSENHLNDLLRCLNLSLHVTGHQIHLHCVMYLEHLGK